MLLLETHTEQLLSLPFSSFHSLRVSFHNFSIKNAECIEWFIEGQTSSWSYDLAPPEPPTPSLPPSVSSTGDTQEDWKKAVASINHSILPNHIEYMTTSDTAPMWALPISGMQRRNSWTKFRQKSSSLAIHSHLYSFALRFSFLQTHTTSYRFYCTLIRRKDENQIENHTLFHMV